MSFSLVNWINDYDDDYESNMLHVECVESEVHGGIHVETHSCKNVCGSGG